MRSNNESGLLQYAKLIVFALCLSMAAPVFGQQKPPVLIVSQNDTLVAITEKDFDTVLFGFSYIKSLEHSNNIASKQLNRVDSINVYLEKVLTLERKKQAQQDSIIINLESVIEKHEKAKKREKLKNVFIQIGAGLVIAAETGVITYLILR